MPFFSVSASEDLYYVWRPASAPADSGLTFLLVHGLGSSSSFYAPVMPRLVEAGFSCLAFDSSGSCLSRYSKDKSIRDIAQDAEALLKGLGILPSKVIAVGHSMGSLVVSHLAVDAGLAGAVLIGSVTPSAALSSAFTQRIQTVEQNGMEAMADTIPAGATGSRATATHHGFIRALLLSQDAQGYIAHCRAIATAELPEYSRVRCPALFIAGQDDRTAPLAAIKRTVSSWGTGAGASKVSLTSLEGVGHWHCIEAGDQVGSLLLGFAQTLSQAEPVSLVKCEKLREQERNDE